MPIPQTSAEVQAPVAKAATALGAGAGTSMLTLSEQAQSFLPTDLGGWLAAAASSAALIYTLCLLTEWWWKKLWKPLLEKWQWK